MTTSNNFDDAGQSPPPPSSSWFSISAPVYKIPSEHALLSRALFGTGSGSGSKSSPHGSDSDDWSSASSSSPPLRPLLPSYRSRRKLSTRIESLAGLQTFARRRVVVLALTILIPCLALLLAVELRSQATARRIWAAEIAERSEAGTPDLLGRLDLGEWRRTRSSEDAEDESQNDTWPAWWGNADKVGPSPFDFAPEPLKPHESRRRVMFLTSYNDYLERMNSHTYEIVDAALRHPHLIVDVWGPGWAGYDWAVPLSVNIKRRANRIAELEASEAEHNQTIQTQRREHAQAKAKWRRRKDSWWGRFLAHEDEPAGVPEDAWVKPAWDTFNDNCNPQVQFDFAWTISDIYKEGDMEHVDALDCNTLLVQQIGDCHSHRCMKEWYPHANNITVSKYAFELEEVFNVDNVRQHYPSFHLGVFGHSPDTANEWDFWPVPWSQRHRKAAVFGFDGEFYPLRTTVTDALRKREEDPTLPESPISRHPHPGYDVHVPEETRSNPLETYELGHETYATHRAIRADFATGMRTAQICVFDSSLERKLIRKYAQAFLSGCVVAGDLPTEHEQVLSNFVIPLEPTWDIDRIHAQINTYLADPARLHQMALDGFAYARKHLSTTSKLSGMLRLVDAHRAGFRGYDHAHSFSSRCRAYWSGDDAPRPSWCDPKDGYRGLEDVE